MMYPQPRNNTDALQSQCLDPATPILVLYQTGRELDQRKSQMSDAQLRIQHVIEGTFEDKVMRVMGYQRRRQ